MATVTGLTASRMLEIEAASVVDGEVVAGNLILSKHDGSQINAGSVIGPEGDPGPTGPAGAGPMTGDYKMSAQTATHSDGVGGTWYLCDGSATVGAALIALVGANLPDARGRALVMMGTHVDVNAIGDSDGLAVGSRRPKHKHTVTDPGHVHSYERISGARDNSPDPVGNDRDTASTANTGSAVTGITVGPQTGSEPTDSSAYIVPGSLFIHS